ncbi:protein PLANT CADMIUM RESISTANCE 10 isoform X1 [Aristolochia californica]|uniref:protein PLANT CADMIUM RESISTANCE 10 isoform X1 n=1 Tax=Aristolochia californica TaxID=171875 RepID=UPI0035D72F1F
MKGQSGYTPPRYIPLDQTDLERETVPRSTVSSHQQVSHDPTQWSSGICACCDDMQSCCIGLFCPCVLFGKNAEFLGAESWTGPCMTHFILWGLVNGLCCMLTDGLLLGIPGSVVACYACGYRKSLRAKYNLQQACSHELQSLVMGTRTSLSYYTSSFLLVNDGVKLLASSECYPTAISVTDTITSLNLCMLGLGLISLETCQRKPHVGT